jgi:hypothetical protein
MLKSLWIIAAIIGIAQAPVNAPRQRGDKQNHASHDATKGNTVSPPVAPAAGQSGAVAQAPQGKPKSDTAQQKPSYWKEAFGPANAPNWALVIVGGIAGYLAWRTVRAVQLQAAAQMNADSAFIAVEIAPFESDPEFWEKQDGTKVVLVEYGITNHGQTPAFIKGVGVKHHILKSKTEEPAEPVWGNILTVNTFLGAGKKNWNSVALTPSDFWQFNRNQQFLKICTKIVYEDIFGATHESVCRIRYHCPEHGNPIRKGFYPESDPKDNYYT